MDQEMLTLLEEGDCIKKKMKEKLKRKPLLIFLLGNEVSLSKAGFYTGAFFAFLLLVLCGGSALNAFYIKGVIFLAAGISFTIGLLVGMVACSE